MTGPHLSAAQARNRLILTARRALTDHAAREDGRCRLCLTMECRTRDAATALLALHTGPDATEAPQ